MPKKCGLIAFAVVLASLGFVSASQASIVAVSLSDDKGSDGPTYYVDTVTFNLPTGFTAAALDITAFGADDRVVLELNGTEISNVGIFGPGAGSFFFTDGGPVVPHTFINGDNSGPFLTLPGATFLDGLNTLTFIVNNTNAGINGGPNGGPTQVQFAGDVTFTAPVPEISTWAMMILGFAGVGCVAYRRKSKPALMAA
jgi:hypothetical protein